MDSSGAAIPNASVDLENDRSQKIVHTVTDQTGRYRLTAPPSGTYRETITAVGFSTVVFDNLRLSEGAVNLPDAMLQVGSATDTIQVRPPVEVAGGQIATEGHVGIFGDVPLQQTPFSVQSYTSTFLENQQALTLTDVLGSDASIISMSASSKASPEADTFLSRGFKMYANTGMAVNGLFGLYADLPDMYFVERLDLFSGPSAFVMGAPESVGGVVNLAPKRAHDRPFLLLEPTYLGKSVYGGHLDASDRFGQHGPFGTRVNGLYREGEGEIRDSRLLNAGASAGLDYRSKIVLLSLDAQYLRNYNKAFQYVLLLGPGLADLPRTMPTNLSTQPVWMHSSAYQKVILGRADVNLSPKWTLTTGSGFSHSSAAYPGYCPALLLDYSGTVLCEQINQVSTQENSSNDVGIRGRVNTGMVSHSFLGGWNRVQQTGNFGDFNDYGPSQTYNLYMPYRPTVPNFILPALSNDFFVDDRSTKGWYLGDTARLFRDRLLITGGFRRTTISLKGTSRENIIPPGLYSDSAFTPSVAGLFKLTSHLSLYGNFIQALEPGWTAPIGTKNAGQAFPPFISNQVEFGAKGHFGRWIGTLALYRISEANGVVSAVTNPPTFTQNGRQVNKGIEIDFTGDLLPGLHAILSASFIDSKQRSTGDPTTEGKSTATIPGATERVNVSWDVVRVKGLNFNGNLMGTGSAPFDAVNSLRVPSWSRLDLGARYSFGREKPLTVRAQVENVLNNEFWVSAFSGGLFPAGPRVVNVSLSKSF
jgi:iron complex outermembrane receptor protein